MTASITRAGERLIAEKQATHQGLEVVRFVLALVPGLDPEQPVDRDAGLPPVQHQVHIQTVTQAGFVNPNQVVYSLMMDSATGDFDWNWMGLVTTEEVLLAVTYVPVQQKRQNRPPVQIGNNVTRNFLLMFDGAQQLTDIRIDASTWQHDFTLRLQAMDERERLSNIDVFGSAAFYSDSFELTADTNGQWLKPGLAYIAGIRLHTDGLIPVTAPAFPNKLWLDVALVREGSEVVGRWNLAWGDELKAYLDSAGVQHHCTLIADVLSSTESEDRRSVFNAQTALIEHFAARTGDYAALRARATTKADVGLDLIPNAISDDPESNSSEVLASTAALHRVNQSINEALVGMVAPFAMSSAPSGWLVCNGANISRTAYAKLFDRIGTLYGSGDRLTTFSLPNLRGLFLRGWDDGRGLDPERAFGSYQEMMIQSHLHGATAAPGGAHGHQGWTDVQGTHVHRTWTDAQGEHAHSAPSSPGVGQGAGGPSTVQQAGGIHATTAAGAHGHNVYMDGAGEHSHNIGIQPSPEHSHLISIAETGGVETRPRNMALLFCIKY